MSEDRIAEIRARHTSETGPRRYELKAQIHDDRAFLLAEIERLREALTDMLNGWRYIRETYGDLAGVGWDRAELKAQEALEGKP